MQKQSKRRLVWEILSHKQHQCLPRIATYRKEGAEELRPFLVVSIQVLEFWTLQVIYDEEHTLLVEIPPHSPPSTKTDINFTHVIRSLRNSTTLLLHTTGDRKLDTGKACEHGQHTNTYLQNILTVSLGWNMPGHILAPQDLQDKTQHVTVMWQSCDHGLHGLLCRRVHLKDGR